jgi:hypothetical protein
MKRKTTNPKVAIMAARALNASKAPRMVAPTAPRMVAPTAPPMGAPTMPLPQGGMPGGMPGMKKGGMAYKKRGCATKSDAKMIAKKEVKGHESSMHKMKMGGKCMATGGKASQLSKANGIAIRGKTKGKIC